MGKRFSMRFLEVYVNCREFMRIVPGIVERKACMVLRPSIQTFKPWLSRIFFKYFDLLRALPSSVSKGLAKNRMIFFVLTVTGMMLAISISNYFCMA
jgi:hypothetical protein